MDSNELKKLLNYIDNVKNYDMGFTKMNFIDKEKFTNTLKQLFNNCEVINYTDFNYSNSYLYDIIFEKNTLELINIRYGVKILISIIAPYGYYYFYEETEKDQEINKYDYIVQDKPIRDEDYTYIELIEQFFSNINYNMIDKLLLKESVPNVNLELKESNVQIGHCLFDDNAGDY